MLRRLCLRLASHIFIGRLKWSSWKKNVGNLLGHFLVRHPLALYICIPAFLLVLFRRKLGHVFSEGIDSSSVGNCEKLTPCSGIIKVLCLCNAVLNRNRVCKTWAWLFLWCWNLYKNHHYSVGLTTQTLKPGCFFF